MIIKIPHCYELSYQFIFALTSLVSLLLILRVSWTFNWSLFHPEATTDFEIISLYETNFKMAGNDILICGMLCQLVEKARK